MIRDLVKFGVIIGLICLVIGGGVAALYGLFVQEIAAREVLEAIDKVRTVCPEGTTPDLDHPLKGNPLKAGEPLDEEAVFAVKDAAGKTVAYVAFGGAQGYSSVVKVAVGAQAGDLSIFRVVVLAQQETPGLGAHVAEEASNYTLWEKIFGPAEAGKTEELVNPFLDGFRGKKEADAPAVHAITAATITSNATKNAVIQALARIRDAVGASGTSKE